ncbi:MFS transporter [Fulvimarina sp. 2208YS6-2-32]|uniref:MFS transporter n=1 Tax=Fulvimarina uroteuthidis TaxID=3098149 RepID=A0ABU5HZ22_9HYPH|nr:MFS transporter [Fulvimarina sp. 2208YS6-2-32]MDY8108132.1 MFS transporter [Fulvimarina sp. 2208YS6-2-32]
MTDFFSFLARNGRWIAGGFLLCFFSSFGQTFFIALSNADIRDAFDLSHGEFGVLYMAATISSAATLPFLGGLLDRYPVAAVSAGTMAMLAVAALALPLAGSVIALGLALYLLRLFGQGMMTEIALTAVGKWFNANRGRAVSVASLGHHVGTAIFPFLFVFAAGFAGWRGAWMISAGIVALLALPLIVALVRQERDPKGDPLPATIRPVTDRTRAEVLKDPNFYVILCGVLAPPFIGTTIFFHQVYLTDLRGWPLEIFALGFMVMSISTMGFSLVAGWLVDRHSSVRLLPTFLLPLAAACLVAAYVDDVWAIFAFMSLLGVSTGFSSTLAGSLWPELYGAAHLGAIRSIVVSGMVLFTALGPGVTGFLIDQGVDYPGQIAAMGFYCLAASLLMFAISRRMTIRQAGDVR